MSASEKRIPLSEERWKELGEMKGAGQTWDDLLAELIEYRKKAKMFEMIDRRNEQDEWVPLDEVMDELSSSAE
jgi:predicted CopG family antitoxin